MWFETGLTAKVGTGRAGTPMFRSWIVAVSCLGGALLSAEPAHAETFRLISGSSNALLLADMDSVRRVGDVASFNTVMFSRRTEHFNGRASWATRTANEINCRTSQRREVRISYLAEGGATISSEAISEGWQPIPRGSVGTAIRDLICDGRATENNLAFGDSFSGAERMARRVLGH